MPSPRHLIRVARRAGDPEEPPAWLLAIPAVAQLLDDAWEVPAGVTVLVGENGSGKSTVVEALAQRYPRLPQDAVGPRAIGDESPLARHLQLTCDPMASRAGFFLRAEAMHGYLRRLDSETGTVRPDPGDVPLLARSHGEGFLEVFQRHFWEPGVYFLDEPESALSFSSCLALVSLLDSLRAEGSQVIVATHSPLIAALPDACLLELGDWGLRETCWEDLDLVQGWRGFLRDPQRYLRHLLA